MNSKTFHTCMHACFFVGPLQGLGDYLIFHDARDNDRDTGVGMLMYACMHDMYAFMICMHVCMICMHICVYIYIGSVHM